MRRIHPEMFLKRGVGPKNVAQGSSAKNKKRDIYQINSEAPIQATHQMYTESTSPEIT